MPAIASVAVEPTAWMPSIRGWFRIAEFHRNRSSSKWKAIRRVVHSTPRVWAATFDSRKRHTIRNQIWNFHAIRRATHVGYRRRWLSHKSIKTVKTPNPVSLILANSSSSCCMFFAGLVNFGKRAASERLKSASGLCAAIKENKS